MQKDPASGQWPCQSAQRGPLVDGAAWILPRPARGHCLPAPPVQGCGGQDEVCLGEGAQLSAVLRALPSHRLGADLSSAQTSGAEVGLRRPRREPLSVLLWGPVVWPWVQPVRKWTEVQALHLA